MFRFLHDPFTACANIQITANTTGLGFRVKGLGNILITANTTGLGFRV